MTVPLENLFLLSVIDLSTIVGASLLLIVIATQSRSFGLFIGAMGWTALVLAMGGTYLNERLVQPGALTLAGLTNLAALVISRPPAASLPSLLLALPGGFVAALGAQLLLMATVPSGHAVLLALALAAGAAMAGLALFGAPGERAPTLALALAGGVLALPAVITLDGIHDGQDTFQPTWLLTGVGFSMCVGMVLFAQHRRSESEES